MSTWSGSAFDVGPQKFAPEFHPKATFRSEGAQFIREPIAWVPIAGLVMITTGLIVLALQVGHSRQTARTAAQVARVAVDTVERNHLEAQTAASKAELAVEVARRAADHTAALEAEIVRLKKVIAGAKP